MDPAADAELKPGEILVAPFTDPAWTPLFRLYRTTAVRELELESEGFEINAEILIALLKAGKKVVEVPVELTRRTEGSSKMSLVRDLLMHARLTFRHLFRG